MKDDRFSARERVAHKLTGAAYQMTFCEEYDHAMQTMTQAVSFWEATREEPLSDTEAAEVYDANGNDGPTEEVATDGNGASDLPSRGTQAREAMVGLLRAHDDGNDWVKASDLDQYPISDEAVKQVSALRHDSKYVQGKDVEGEVYNLYRVTPSKRDTLRRELQAVQ